MRRDLDRVEDICAAIEDVERFCCNLDRESLQTDKVVRYALLYSLTIIGEAANRVSADLQHRHPEVPWRRIVGFRHRLIHDYGALDLDLVWDVAVTLVPQLKAQIEAIRDALGREGEE